MQNLKDNLSAIQKEENIQLREENADRKVFMNKTMNG